MNKNERTKLGSFQQRIYDYLKVNPHTPLWKLYQKFSPIRHGNDRNFWSENYRVRNVLLSLIKRGIVQCINDQYFIPGTIGLVTKFELKKFPECKFEVFITKRECNDG